MDKDEKSRLLVMLSTNLLRIVQGCSNHNCCFRELAEGRVGTNAICSCNHMARQAVRGITDILSQD